MDGETCPTLRDALRALGLRPIAMLTGDNAGVAAAIPRASGWTRCAPNDAPALATATLGLARAASATIRQNLASMSAIAIHEVSTLVVLANSLRLPAYRARNEPATRA